MALLRLYYGSTTAWGYAALRAGFTSAGGQGGVVARLIDRFPQIKFGRDLDQTCNDGTAGWLSAGWLSTADFMSLEAEIMLYGGGCAC